MKKEKLEKDFKLKIATINELKKDGFKSWFEVKLKN
jgi:hypothetical protein